MTDKFAGNINEHIEKFGMNNKIGNFGYMSSTETSIYYEFDIYVKFDPNIFASINNNLPNGTEFILKGQSTYLKVINVPGINESDAHVALLRLVWHI